MLQQFLRRKFPQGFLIIISLIIIFLYICFIIILVLDISLWNQVPKIIFLIIYHIILLLFVWSIVQSMITDPGHVPKQWGFPIANNQRKYCIICHVFKPERTHHCGTCNRCVLNMDHHCPWINSCIGFYNRKAFILMLFYTILVTALNILIGLCCIQPIIDNLGKNSSIIYKVIIGVIGFILNCVIFGAILNFFRFHISLILNNYTTLEILEMKRQHKQKQPQSPYDIGSYYNWVQVFGRNWITWFIPIFLKDEGPSGDGVIWPKFSNQMQQEISH